MNPVVDAGGICDHIAMYSIRLSRSAPLWVAAVVALTIAGCDAPTAPQLVTHSLSQPLTGPCPTDPSVLGQGEFVGDVSEFGATISGPDISEPLMAGGTGSLTIDNVPEGENRIIALFGLANGQARWRGVSAPTTVVKDVPQTVDIVLAAVSDFSCARTASGAHVFHTATPLNDGTVLVVGGAATMVDASVACGGQGNGGPCLKATATASAAVYDPKTGVFIPAGRLAQGRMFHTATKLADGRVVIAGGAGEATFFMTTSATRPFPVVPDAPIVSVEVFDPTTRQFTSAANDPGGARIFAASTTLLSGEALITGGIPSRAQTGNHDLSNALKTTTICGGNVVACRAGPPMVSARAGHVAFTTEPQGVYLWGGSVDTSVDGHHVEYLQPDGAAFVRLLRASMFGPSTVNPDNRTRKNIFFAGVAQYVDYRVLIAGGLTRKTTGEFSAEFSDLAYIFDVGGDDKDLSENDVKGGVTPPVRMQSRRIFTSAAGLPDESSGIVIGGFDADDLATIDWTPSGALDLFSEAVVGTPDARMSTLDVVGTPRTMRQPRGGATATAIGDGTVVIVGGYTGNDDIAETAEVFADRLTPPQAAEYVK